MNRPFYTAFAILIASTSFTYAQIVDNIAINEFMAVNDSLSPWTDPAGQHEDWIELYNKNNTTVNLGGCYLSDDYLDPAKWQMPAGVSIAANGYLIIWADDDLNQTGLHAPFKLDREGEMLILSRPDLTVMDSVTFGYQENNLSYARIPNGTGNFVITDPTFNAFNGGTATEEPAWSAQINVFPNPVTDNHFTCILPLEKDQKVSQIALFSPEGKRIITWPVTGIQPAIRLDLPGLTAGAYWLSFSSSDGDVFRKLMILR